MKRQRKEKISENSDPIQLSDILSRHVECCICMAVCHNAASCTPCLHSFCVGCIAKWCDKYKKQCPSCRVSVKDITPNRMVRDLVTTYLECNPSQKRTEKEVEELDRAELEYTVKWLGDTDEKLLYIESLASLRGVPEEGGQRTTAMMSRAMELFKQFLGANEQGYSNDVVKNSLKNLIEDVKDEVFPTVLLQKYRRLEKAYKKIVKAAEPEIGPGQHTWLGTHFLENGSDEDNSDEDSTDIEENFDLPGRIEDTLTAIRRRETEDARPRVGALNRMRRQRQTSMQWLFGQNGEEEARPRAGGFNQVLPEQQMSIQGQNNGQRVAPLRSASRRLRRPTPEPIPAAAPIQLHLQRPTSSSGNTTRAPPRLSPRRSVRLAGARMPGQ